MARNPLEDVDDIDLWNEMEEQEREDLGLPDDGDEDEDVVANEEETYYDEYGGEAVYDPWYDLDLGGPFD